jgi:hypothetical protein
MCVFASEAKEHDGVVGGFHGVWIARIEDTALPLWNRPEGKLIASRDYHEAFCAD